MKETDIQSKILKYLLSIGAYSVKTMVTNRNGVPDILCCLNGSFFAFEVKKPGKKPTKLQLWNIEKIIKSGGRAIAVVSVDDVKNYVECLNVL